MLTKLNCKLAEKVQQQKTNGKLNSYFNGFDTYQIIDIFIKNSSSRIDLDQKIEERYNNKNNTYCYITEKGYKSAKLKNIFNDFYRFMVYPNETIENIVLAEKFDIINEKYNLEYDNPERDEGTIKLSVSKLVELFIEAAKKNPHQEIKMLNEQIKIIL